MAVYDFNKNDILMLKEFDIYGSSRVGILHESDTLTSHDIDADTIPDAWQFSLGDKEYEQTNHLGNVLSTITDKPVAVDYYSDTYFDYYYPEYVTAQDYYPFGMLQPDRHIEANDSCYRFGFNGKEKDNEMKGLGNQQDYGMRIYDPRISKFLSVDPISKKFPMLTPYQFASNSPIWATDLDGREARVYTETKGTGHTFLTVQDGNDIIVYTYGRYAGGDWYSAGATGKGVMVRYTGELAKKYVTSELHHMDAKVFEIKNADECKVKDYMDKLYNVSQEKPNTKNKEVNEYGHVVDTYTLTGNNCTTKSCNGLKEGGTEIFNTEGILGKYDEDFAIPSSLQNFLESNTGSTIVEVTDKMKQKFPNTSNQNSLKSAGSFGTTSGSSGDCSGSSANTSSSDGSSSGNNSGSSSGCGYDDPK